ncbi:hypothetical protein [Novosphingobium rosa]|uniref:hypothetical protein n=1 Tax=Novosphingobium rosa TaxID=76978 RepID=UPI00082D81D4|nr:hypothetical protein [Novosphingobium rosa]
MTASLLTRMPITIREWRLRLTDLCRMSALAPVQDENAMLRMAYHLLACLPETDSLLGDHLPPLAQFDTLLSAGAHDTAALALIPESGSFLLSRNGDGTCLASVLLPGLEEEMTSEGTTPALALVSALAAALASLAPEVEAPMIRCEASAFGDAPLAGDTALAATDPLRDDPYRRPAGIALH